MQHRFRESSLVFRLFFVFPLILLFYYYSSSLSFFYWRLFFVFLFIEPSFILRLKKGDSFGCHRDIKFFVYMVPIFLCPVIVNSYGYHHSIGEWDGHPICLCFWCIFCNRRIHRFIFLCVEFMKRLFESSWGSKWSISLPDLSIKFFVFFFAYIMWLTTLLLSFLTLRLT